ncbi:hypothetical protein Sfulv_19940 [Streptomyces fulvorobeus]|uniref:Uncharacterized protein n=1 Tax=Streptomyces fulvorobeus TaxID=284028 RepID=A0A7J0C5K0_9ACTN|nr:hypothetical protein Sfulv_19940 [Streptomyces fulvorobeus]
MHHALEIQPTGDRLCLDCGTYRGSVDYGNASIRISEFMHSQPFQRRSHHRSEGKSSVQLACRLPWRHTQYRMHDTAPAGGDHNMGNPLFGMHSRLKATGLPGCEVAPTGSAPITWREALEVV